MPLVDDPSTAFVAWTTTPWTLPSNLALAVNPEFTYLKIKDEEHDRMLIVAEPRLKDVCKQNKIKKHTVVDKMKGTDLVGIKYIPPFDYFKNLGEGEKGCFRVIGASFVDASTGTGIVHQAPGFGEDDYNLNHK